MNDRSYPEWAVLLPTGTVTREFGRFEPDSLTGVFMGGPIEHAAIFRAVSGEPGYAIRIGFDNDTFAPVVITMDLPQPFTPSGGDLGFNLELIECEQNNSRYDR